MDLRKERALRLLRLSHADAAYLSLARIVLALPPNLMCRGIPMCQNYVGYYRGSTEHVERNSLCIHSQLKSPSSSEVASMIEGVVHHCTEMEVDRQYVDSHGQSTVAFAFCRLLGFQLMPRLKAIHVQRLSRPDGAPGRL